MEQGVGDLGGVVCPPWEYEYVVCRPMELFDNAPLVSVLDGDRRARLGELPAVPLARVMALAVEREAEVAAGKRARTVMIEFAGVRVACRAVDGLSGQSRMVVDGLGRFFVLTGTGWRRFEPAGMVFDW